MSKRPFLVVPPSIRDRVQEAFGSSVEVVANAPLPAEADLVSVTLSGRKIVTTRHYADEWTATEDEWDLGMPQGSGKTEQAAIDDLLEQIEERS